mmetsp:Transcript_1738/g.2497  ORF Transcript_1738/g.2497 Transcript_1738/m.2497 type:complete len:140 (-) Transcript_1738:783-1202(-)
MSELNEGVEFSFLRITNHFDMAIGIATFFVVFFVTIDVLEELEYLWYLYMGSLMLLIGLSVFASKKAESLELYCIVRGFFSLLHLFFGIYYWFFIVEVIELKNEGETLYMIPAIIYSMYFFFWGIIMFLYGIIAILFCG